MCFTADEKSALAAKLGKPAETDDKELLADLVTNWNSANAAKADAETKVAALSAELDAAKGQVLSLSATAPRELAPHDAAAFDFNVQTLRESAITAGAVSAADAAKFDALLMPGGKPGALALSASGENRHPFAYNFWRAMREIQPGLKTENAVARGEPSNPPTYAGLSLSGGGGHDDKGEPVSKERLRELMEMAGYHGTAAAAAK